MLTNIDIKESCETIGVPLVGVFSKDKLPDTPSHGGYVINMQDSDEGHGTHWVALVVHPDRRAEYFDSFGIGPPTAVSDFIAPRRIEWSQKHIQNINSGVCGSYCLAFLWWVCVKRGDLASFQRLFSVDPAKNRGILEELIAPL